MRRSLLMRSLWLILHCTGPVLCRAQMVGSQVWKAVLPNAQIVRGPSCGDGRKRAKPAGACIFLPAATAGLSRPQGWHILPKSGSLCRPLRIGGRLMPDEILTLPEVAQLLKVAEKTVYTMAQKSQLPAFKEGRQWRFKRVDIDEWIERQKAVSSNEKGS